MIIDTEKERLSALKKTFKFVKECLWHGQNKKRN